MTSALGLDLDLTGVSHGIITPCQMVQTTSGTIAIDDDDARDTRGTRKSVGRRRSSSKKEGDGKSPNFLTRLYIADPAYQEMIHWDVPGKQIIVADPDGLESTVLPMTYNQSRFASFSRQLNIYGFMRKVSTRLVERVSTAPEMTIWSHLVLDRNTPVEDLLAHKRRVPPRIYARKNSDNPSSADVSPVRSDVDLDDNPRSARPSYHNTVGGQPRWVRERLAADTPMGVARRTSLPVHTARHPYRARVLHTAGSDGRMQFGPRLFVDKEVGMVPMDIGMAPDGMSLQPGWEFAASCPMAAEVLGGTTDPIQHYSWATSTVPASAPAVQHRFQLATPSTDPLFLPNLEPSATFDAPTLSGRLGSKVTQSPNVSACGQSTPAQCSAESYRSGLDGSSLPSHGSDYKASNQAMGPPAPRRQSSDNTLQPRPMVEEHHVSLDPSVIAQGMMIGCFGHVVSLADRPYISSRGGQDHLLAAATGPHTAQPILSYLDGIYGLPRSLTQPQQPLSIQTLQEESSTPSLGETQRLTSTTHGTQNSSTMWLRTPSSGYDGGNRSLTALLGQQSIASLASLAQLSQDERQYGKEFHNSSGPSASHPNTPGAILSELYARRRPITGFATLGLQTPFKTQQHVPGADEGKWMVLGSDFSEAAEVSLDDPPVSGSQLTLGPAARVHQVSRQEAVLGMDNIFGSWPWLEPHSTAEPSTRHDQDALLVYPVESEPSILPGETMAEEAHARAGAECDGTGGGSGRGSSEMGAYIHMSDYSFDARL